MNWVNEITVKAEGEVIAIDGKTSRGSKDTKKAQSPLHLVSAWACANRLVLGQEATAEKSNEIPTAHVTAIPKLLALLDIKGCIVTIDAMGCQTDIAAQVIEQGGDYSLGLKGNQESLHEAVEDYFITAKAADFKAVTYDYVEEIDQEHGRLETRRYWICEDLTTLPKPERWKGLRSIGRSNAKRSSVARPRWNNAFLSTPLKPMPRHLLMRCVPIGALRIACIGGLMW